MAKVVTMAIGFVAGVALCFAIIVAAILRFRQNADVKSLLVSLAAAAVALVLGLLTQIIITFNAPLALPGYPGATASSALFAYVLALLSAPVGMGWGWASSLVRNPATAAPGETAGAFAVRGLMLGLLAGSGFTLACLLATLARHGHDNTIAVPGLAAACSFLGAMIFTAALALSRCWDESIGAVLRHIGIGVGATVLLALGVLAGATAVVSLSLDMGRRAEAWNVLIFFYPIYILGLIALAAALLLFAAKTFVRMQSRLPAS